jgi:hypothetical protein
MLRGWCGVLVHLSARWWTQRLKEISDGVMCPWLGNIALSDLKDI